jgi:hypothetical protein
MSMTTRPYVHLPDMVGSNLRRPTVEECELVGRDVEYAAGMSTGVHRDDGDTVIVDKRRPRSAGASARAFEAFGMCDEAHVIPAGVYLEE